MITLSLHGHSTKLQERSEHTRHRARKQHIHTPALSHPFQIQFLQ